MLEGGAEDLNQAAVAEKYNRNKPLDQVFEEQSDEDLQDKEKKGGDVLMHFDQEGEFDPYFKEDKSETNDLGQSNRVMFKDLGLPMLDQTENSMNQTDRQARRPAGRKSTTLMDSLFDKLQQSCHTTGQNN